jgi:hypothetical protein
LLARRYAFIASKIDPAARGQLNKNERWAGPFSDPKDASAGCTTRFILACRSRSPIRSLSGSGLNRRPSRCRMAGKQPEIAHVHRGNQAATCQIRDRDDEGIDGHFELVW